MKNDILETNILSCYTVFQTTCTYVIIYQMYENSQYILAHKLSPNFLIKLLLDLCAKESKSFKASFIQPWFKKYTKQVILNLNIDLQ